jgi:cytochrome P450 family 142 subfamily A polypeptide 1
MRTDQMVRDPAVAIGLMDTIVAFNALLTEVAAERRACPADDLVTDWVEAGMDPITLIHETGLFIAGGAETTRTAISRGLAVLAEHPEQWEAAAADPSLIPGLVEEVIRWVTPLNNFFRTALRDDRVGDQPVAAGDRLMLVYPSANRDEAVFERPYTFDIRRDPNPHVAFGQGTHFCLGANLARLELRMLFERLTQAWTNLRVLEAPDIEPNIFAGAVRSFRLGFDRRER